MYIDRCVHFVIALLYTSSQSLRCATCCQAITHFLPATRLFFRS